MSSHFSRLPLLALLTAAAAGSVVQPGRPPVEPASAMHWRHIGPTRAGRARPVSGVAQQPNVAYIGLDNGGVWRSTGYGMFKSTDAGRTWTRLGLTDSQMIAHIEVAPRDPNRLFVAVLGHPYGPNAERGIFRSTDGGRSFEKVLDKGEYTSADDVRIDPSDPNIVYAALWTQQQSFTEGGAFGGTGGGIFKSTDGGTTWKPLTVGLP